VVYTAHNPHNTPLEVTFADGTIIEVPPMGYAHLESGGERESPGCAVGTVQPGMFLLLLAGLLMFVR